MYREITENGRVVAACIRSLENANSSNSRFDVDQQQPKSLDSSVGHDSLDTQYSATTATSSDSRRDEKVLKALQRRYHLVYLRAIEIQCMFERLLEKRTGLKEIEEFQQSPIDTSDDEPVAKLAKFDNEYSFTSCKSREEKGEESGTEFDADADSEGSENEMDFVAVADSVGSDCVDGALIIPVKQSTPPKTPSPNATFETPKGTVIKRIRPKDFSKFHRSNRKSKNCAIFYFKHDDTDNDQANGNDNEPEKPLDSSEASEEEVWEYSNTSNDVSPLTPDKNENISDVLDCQPLMLQASITKDDESTETAETAHKNSQQRYKFNGNVSTPALVSFKLTLSTLYYFIFIRVVCGYSSTHKYKILFHYFI